jgi:hypothetical protein
MFFENLTIEGAANNYGPFLCVCKLWPQRTSPWTQERGQTVLASCDCGVQSKKAISRELHLRRSNSNPPPIYRTPIDLLELPWEFDKNSVKKIHQWSEKLSTSFKILKLCNITLNFASLTLKCDHELPTVGKKIKLNQSHCNLCQGPQNFHKWDFPC